MSCRSTYSLSNLSQSQLLELLETCKTLCLPLTITVDNRSFQIYSQLSFALHIGPQHSELHYCPSNVGPPYCEKCRSANLTFPFSGGSVTFFTQTVALRSTRNLSTLRAEIHVNVQSYLTPVIRHASRQLSELTNVGSGATQIPSAVRVDILTDRSFQSYKILSTLKVEIFLAFRATQQLEDARLPVNYPN